MKISAQGLILNQIDAEKIEKDFKSKKIQKSTELTRVNWPTTQIQGFSKKFIDIGRQLPKLTI